MNELFGISMTYVMIALLVILGVALAAIGWVLVRNRIMFLIGVRNIPRRRAQTTLIIVGLMLSTLIISTAFSIGDTVDYSITNAAYDRLHSIDEVVQVQSGDEEDPIFGEGGGGLVSAATIPESQSNQFVRAFRDLDGVDGAIGVVRGPASVQNVTKQQTEPLIILMGVPTDGLEGFESDFETLSGQRVTPGDLAGGEIFANESAAGALDIDPGDELLLFVNNEPHEFTVKDVLKDRALTGSLQGVPEGFMLPQDRVQEMFGRENQIDFIAVSNDGGVRDGMDNSDAFTDNLNELVQGTRLVADSTKKDAVELASDASSFMVTFFVILGLFSISAGMLLIFLIFVMLAAERKVEMGMARAVGTQRRHLVQMFMSEGMVYNVGAAAVGCALGIVVSMVLVGLMARLFADFDLSITFNVTPRSLIVSYSVGVVLTFLTVTFSSWRIGNLNIVSAIRDLPDPPPHADRPGFRDGGVWGALRFVRWLIFKPQSLRQWLTAGGVLVLAALLGGLAALLFSLVGPLYDSSALGAVLAVILAVIGGLVAVAAVVTLLIALNSIFQTGTALSVVGLLLILAGVGSDQAGPFGLGLSALVFGIAMVLAQLRLPARPVYTTAGLFLLVGWLLLAGGNTPFEALNEMEGDIEMFFISGISMVLAATFVLVYNADLMLGLLTWLGSVFPRLVPAIKTAVAYPLANKFRTGMTIAMISLVMFALVMMSTMNENFDRVFLSPDAKGGYDVLATENPGNPIPDLISALEGSDSEQRVDTSQIAAVDTMRQANPQVSDIALQDNDGIDWENYSIYGLSDGFLERNELAFQQRARGYESDDAVWEALASGGNVAVIDTFAVGGGGFGGGGFQLEGVEPTDDVFEPVTVLVRDSASNRVVEVEVIAVLNTASSGLFGGLLISDRTFDELYDRPLFTNHLLQLEDGADAREVAQGIEASLLAQGVQAESLSKIIDDYQAQSRGFLYLIQGFMGIGLFVGIAAVGVIAFRTVVERRQQIGMLRAIGYTRRQVALSFLMESSFTALLGIVSGIILALLLAYMLINTDDFVPGGVESFYIPWLQIGLIGGFAFLASIIMTIIPSRQASSIPIAEALRYE